jgi:hypothetical protein
VCPVFQVLLTPKVNHNNQLIQLKKEPPFIRVIQKAESGEAAVLETT